MLKVIILLYDTTFEQRLNYLLNSTYMGYYSILVELVNLVFKVTSIPYEIIK